MSGQFFRTMFSPAARKAQVLAGSRAHYASVEAVDTAPDTLGRRELEFIEARDSFYISTVTPDGWPYIQHRGGEPGFLKTLSSNLLCFGDLGGNRQFITAANLQEGDRVALFLMDYAARRRLKVIGHAKLLAIDAVPESLGFLPRGAERVVVIQVVGFDWNCPQHITCRFTASEVEAKHVELELENAQLRAERDILKGHSR